MFINVVKNYFFPLFCFLSCVCYAKTIYFVPYPGTIDSESLFFKDMGGDETNKKWVLLAQALQKKGYEIKFTLEAENLKDVHAIISITNVNENLLNNLKAYPKERCWLFIFEPPVYLPTIYDPIYTNWFSKIFVLFDDLVDNQQYFKFYYPFPRQSFNYPLKNFNEKKLCVLISGNKKSSHPNELYSERKNLYSFFLDLKTDECDLYGKGWDTLPTWKGVIGSKWEILKNYKFNICYENMKDQYGYITEKIFDSFVSGCVPIYLGASNIDEYVPKNCFIDRREFSSNLELYQFLKNMEESTYENYISSIKQYFESPQAQFFSIDTFIHLFEENLNKLND